MNRKPPRRWFRSFSLRFLFLVISIFAVVFAALTHRAARLRERHFLLTRLAAQGLRIGRSTHDSPLDRGICWTLGYEGAQPNAIYVPAGVTLTDATKRDILGFTSLRSLQLNGCDIAQADVQAFSEMENLENLMICDCRIAEGDPLRSLHLPQVRSLTVPDDFASDGLVETLRGLNRLAELTFRSTAHLPHRAATVGDNRAGAEDGRLTSRGARVLALLPSLRILSLDSPNISDCDAYPLAHLPNLARIEFYNCPITNFTVDYFHRNSCAEQLDAINTWVSNAPHEWQAGPYRPFVSECRIEQVDKQRLSTLGIEFDADGSAVIAQRYTGTGPEILSLLVRGPPKELHLLSSRLTSYEVELLARYTTCPVVHVSGDWATRDVLAHVLQFPGVEHVQISGDHLVARDVLGLNAGESLRWLVIPSHLPKSTVRRLEDQMPNVRVRQ